MFELLYEFDIFSTIRYIIKAVIIPSDIHMLPDMNKPCVYI